MAIKQAKATTNGQRGMSFVDGAQLTAKKPTVKSLLSRGKKVTGRGGQGFITIRHRGGGTRSHVRAVDFNRADKLGIEATISAIEYDPKRTAYIAVAVYKDGEKRYVLAHKKMAVGDTIITDIKAKEKEGNRMHLQNIPVGFEIYNIELKQGKGGQIVRSAGNSAKLVSLDGEKAQIQLPSGETRLLPKNCFATIGALSNEEQNQIRVGKAGRKRHMGRRPQVRGKAMNPNDHPHGGGEAGTSIGMTHPKTPWGAPALGVKTRKNKVTDKHILISRHRAKKKK